MKALRTALARSALLSITCCVVSGAAGTLGSAAFAAVPEQTLVDCLSAEHANAAKALPEGDDEDPLEIPGWFRALLRRQLPGLPSSGQPQYPRQAVDVLRWLQANPSATEHEAMAKVEELRRQLPAVAAANARRSRYSKGWDVPVPRGTALEALSRQLDDRLDLLPERDLEDQAPLPVWFRVYLRQQFPELARSGAYQYPRTASRILQRLLDNPNSVERVH